MKKVGNLMKEAGFNPKASQSVKEAYIKHLIKAAAGVNVPTPSEKKEMEAHPQKVLSMSDSGTAKNLPLPQQLSFDFADLDVPMKRPKKASTF